MSTASSSSSAPPPFFLSSWWSASASWLSAATRAQETEQHTSYGDAAVTPHPEETAAVDRYESKETAAPHWYRWTSQEMTPAAIQKSAAPLPAHLTTLDPRRRCIGSRSSLAHDTLSAQTARTDCRTNVRADKAGTAVDTITGRFKPARAQSNNLHRLYLTRNAARLLEIERRNAEAEVQGPKFIAGEAPHRPQGPHPHMYQSLHEDPLPLLGPRSGVQMAYLERLRAIDATAGPSALLPASMEKHVEALVASATTTTTNDGRGRC